MPDITLEDLKETIYNVGTFLAKLTGASRPRVIKTRDMPDQERNALGGNVCTFSYLAAVAQAIEEKAKECKLKGIERMARACKIKIKDYFVKWLKAYNDSSPTVSQHLTSAITAMYQLLDYLIKHLFPMSGVIAQALKTLDDLNINTALPSLNLNQLRQNLDTNAITNPQPFSLPNPLQ